MSDTPRKILVSMVSNPLRLCPILVAPGLMASVGAEVRKVSKAVKAMVATDTVVERLHLAALRESLESAGFEVITHAFPAGEAHKHPATLMPAYERFLSSQIDRQTPLLALGGGVVGDMAGFLAATLLRGVPFFQVPTTLMAMVDSSIGGKTGVNQPGPQGGKNLIGAFHHPQLVFADPLLLNTLPESELRCGLAECIKHDAIFNIEHFARLETDLPRYLARDTQALTELVGHNASVKATFVSQDPTEKGIRAFLNFGHTFGHALESVTRHEIPHGQAVGLGMVAAARLSTELGQLPDVQRRRLVSLISKAGLDRFAAHPALRDHDALLSAMQRDKKTESGQLTFIVIAPLGGAVIRRDVPMDAVRRTLSQWQADLPGL